MTALALLGTIIAAFFVQVAVVIGIAAYRQRLTSGRGSAGVRGPAVGSDDSPAELRRSDVRGEAEARIHVRRTGGLRASLISREVIPFYLSLALLGGAALALDALLHWSGLVWIGRYLGIPGVLLVIASSAYSMRKRKLIKWGKPVSLLHWHERLAWAGSLLILVHAGIHFNAVLAWLAVWAMLINIASGLTGKFLLGRSRKRLEARRDTLRAQGLAADEIESRTHWDSLTFDAVKKWRVVHLPITLAFAVLALAHIIAIFLFWGWI